MAIKIGTSKAISLKSIAGGKQDEDTQESVKVASPYSQYKDIGKGSQTTVSVNTDEAHNYIHRKR